MAVQKTNVILPVVLPMHYIRNFYLTAVPYLIIVHIISSAFHILTFNVG